MTRWYEHRFHNVTGRCNYTRPHTEAATLPPSADRSGEADLLPPVETRAPGSGRQSQTVSGKRGLALQWKVYWVFYSFCDLMVSYCFVPQATHSQLLNMLVYPERGGAKIDQCLAAGHGLIVWTAHVGNWEFASRLLEMHGRPVNVARVVEDKPAEITATGI